MRCYMRADPLGIILGEALDKAVGALVRAWPLVLVIWAIHAVTAEFPATSQGIGASAVYFLVSPIEAYIGLRVLMPELGFATGWIVRFLIGSIGIFTLTLGLLGVIIGFGAASTAHGAATNPALPLFFGVGVLVALVIAAWVGVKLAFAPVITVYEGRPLITSFRRSWWLVSGSFRQTFVFLIAITLIIGLLYALPVGIGSVITTTYIHDVAAQAKWKMWLEVAFIPTQTYGQIASYIAYARFLELLESRAEGRSANPTNAPSPAA